MTEIPERVGDDKKAGSLLSRPDCQMVPKDYFCLVNVKPVFIPS